jgi:hypothetical protein
MHVLVPIPYPQATGFIIPRLSKQRHTDSLRLKTLNKSAKVDSIKKTTDGHRWTQIIYLPASAVLNIHRTYAQVTEESNRRGTEDTEE